MKKFIFLVLTNIFLFSFEINFANGVLIKSNLKNRFVKYWSYRASDKLEKSYNLEMPYLRYLYSKDWYKEYLFSTAKLKKIRVKNIICKNNICIIGMVIKLGRNKYYIKDKWVKVNNTWYHRFNDNPLPMM